MLFTLKTQSFIYPKVSSTKLGPDETLGAGLPDQIFSKRTHFSENERIFMHSYMQIISFCLSLLLALSLSLSFSWHWQQAAAATAFAAAVAAAVAAAAVAAAAAAVAAAATALAFRRRLALQASAQRP